MSDEVKLPPPIFTVKDIRRFIAGGVHYKLIGARTGKVLANSHINKEEFIKTFDNCDVPDGAIFSRIEVSGGTYSTEWARPVIYIWVSGK